MHTRDMIQVELMMTDECKTCLACAFVPAMRSEIASTALIVITATDVYWTNAVPL